MDGQPNLRSCRRRLHRPWRPSKHWHRRNHRLNHLPPSTDSHPSSHHPQNHHRELNLAHTTTGRATPAKTKLPCAWTTMRKCSETSTPTLAKVNSHWRSLG